MYAVGRPVRRSKGGSAAGAGSESVVASVTPQRASTPGDFAKRLLIIFRHGLGDCVQLQIVLRHLAHYWPDVAVDVEIGRGKASAVHHLCRRVFEHGVDAGPSAVDYDRIEDLGWYENYSCDPSLPQTKPVNCLREVFRLEPILDLFDYAIEPPAVSIGLVAEYLQSASNGRRILGLHYQGNTSEEKKNLPHEVAAAICTFARGAGWCVVILDWDGRTPLVDNEWVFNPGTANPIWGKTGTGDAAVIAAIVQQCDLFVGVDSGPLHVAAGVDGADVVGVWLEHSPVQFFDLPARGASVMHLVPEDWPIRPPVNGNSSVVEFVRSQYGIREYPIGEGLHTGAARELLRVLAEKMGVVAPKFQTVETGDPGNLVQWGGWWIHADNVYQDLIVIRDVYSENCYQTHHLPIRDDAEVIVDIGGHIGSFARLWHERNPRAIIACVEVCPENIEALRRNVDHFAYVINAACTYETGELALKNACFSNCESTGGSMIVAVPSDPGVSIVDELDRVRYTDDRRPIRKVTLEEIMEFLGVGHIDVLKLDCEGSEFSILANSPAVHDGRVRFILGEYHGLERWEQLRANRFAGWDYGHMRDGNIGLFHLRPPAMAWK